MLVGIKLPLPKVPEVLTTGQFARICRVAPRTVSKWFDTGRLHGYKLPGSLDRRIPTSEAVRFLRENGFPVPPELVSRRAVSYGLQPGEVFDELVDFTCPLLFGQACAVPGIVAAAILGDRDGIPHLLTAAGIVRACSPFARIVAVIGEDSDPIRLKDAAPKLLLDEIVRRPANWPLILASALTPEEPQTSAKSRYASTGEDHAQAQPPYATGATKARAR